MFVDQTRNDNRATKEKGRGLGTSVPFSRFYLTSSFHILRPTETDTRSAPSHSPTPSHAVPSRSVYVSHLSFVITSSRSTLASLHTSPRSHPLSHVREVATSLLPPSSSQYTSSPTLTTPPTKDQTQTPPSHILGSLALSPAVCLTTQIHSSLISHPPSHHVEELSTSPRTVSHPLLLHTDSSSPSTLPSPQTHSPNTSSHSTHSSSHIHHSLHQTRFDSITTTPHPTLHSNPTPHSIHSLSYQEVYESLRDQIHTSQTHFLLSLPMHSTSSSHPSTPIHSTSNESASHLQSFHTHSQATTSQHTLLTPTSIDKYCIYSTE